MPNTIIMDFKSTDPGRLDLTLGDTLRIAGTPGTTRNDAYVYKFSANNREFAEFWVSGISIETGGAPDKDYLIPDSILDVMGGATEIEVEVQQRHRDIYLPPETDQILQTRMLLVRITSTQISAISLSESNETQEIYDRFGTFVQHCSRIAARVTATAPNGSTIARIDVFDGQTASGQRLGSLILTPGREEILALAVPEDAPIARYGEQFRTVVVTDGRGLKVQRTLALTAVWYAHPAVIRLKLRRAEEDGTPSAAGKRVRAQVEAEVQSLLRAGIEKNTAKLTFRWKLFGAADWSEAALYPSRLKIDEEFLLPTSVHCELDRNYSFELVLSDWLHSVTRNSLISASGAMMSLHSSGMGVAVGKRATDSGLLDVALPAKFQAQAEFHAPAAFGSDVSMVLPLPASSGGTGARSLSELKTAMGLGNLPVIQRGNYTFTLAASANAVTHTVYFSPAYKTAPTVLLQLQLLSVFNVVTYAVSNVTTAYFQFQVTNGNAVQKNCVMHWVALGD